MTDYQVAVVGLGGIGSAAAYWASRYATGSVIGLERFGLGHGNGGSEDHSRIIRLSYHTPDYVRLARSAYEVWADVEAVAGEQLVVQTGGLDIAAPGAVIGLDPYRESMAAAGVGFEELTAREVMARWPQWRLPSDATALYQPEAGLVAASRANSAHRRLAREHGAELLETMQVTDISERGGAVLVETGEGTFSAESLIVASGAWTNAVLTGLGVELPIEATLEQVVYLEPDDPGRFAPDRFPIWIWADLPSYYGFPVFGEPAVKLSWDRCEVVVDPDRRSHDPLPEVTAALRRFAADHLPGADRGLRVEKTCLYTLTPDRDFVVDRVPGTDRVFFAVGAGHAFKFASLIGQALAELAVYGESRHPIAGFAADRARLRGPDPVRSYLI